MLDDELKRIIDGKNIKSFWELFDYLTLCGYNQMDTLGISLKYFTEYEIWKDVAYAKLNQKEVKRKVYNFGVDPIHGDEYQRNADGAITNITHVGENIKIELTLEVGMVDDDNKHLIGLFDFYRKSIVEGKLSFNEGLIKDIEDNCRVTYNFTNLTEFVLLLYLQDTSNKHFGYNILDSDIKASSEIVNTLLRQ